MQGTYFIVANPFTITRVNLNEEERVKTAVLSRKVHTEWITFLNLLAKKLEDSIILHFKELITNKMLVTMFPNLPNIDSIGLTLPISTASVERKFHPDETNQNMPTNVFSEGRLTLLMRIAIESPD